MRLAHLNRSVAQRSHRARTSPVATLLPPESPPSYASTEGWRYAFNNEFTSRSSCARFFASRLPPHHRPLPKNLYAQKRYPSVCVCRLYCTLYVSPKGLYFHSLYRRSEVMLEQWTYTHRVCDDIDQMSSFIRAHKIIQYIKWALTHVYVGSRSVFRTICAASSLVLHNIREHAYLERYFPVPNSLHRCNRMPSQHVTWLSAHIHAHVCDSTVTGKRMFNPLGYRRGSQHGFRVLIYSLCIMRSS
jgi:hypothetical protein